MARLCRALAVEDSRWWGHDAITRQCVMDHWRNGSMEFTAHSKQPGNWTRDRHLRRVAFFCAHGWRHPVVVSIQGEHVRVIDGLHRILASWVLNHRVIVARVIGGDASKYRLLSISPRQSALFFPSPMVLGKGRPRPDLPDARHFSG